jgi:hypothetical protein
MPLARIEVRRTWPAEQVQAIIEAIYLAQREALKVPEGDRQIRFIEHKPEHFHVPPGKTDNYTLVEINIFAGRSMVAKRALYQAIVKNLGATLSSCSMRFRSKTGQSGVVYPRQKLIWDSR